MRVGLLNLEPQYCNLALEKLRVYYGESAEDYMPLRYNSYDLIYCSSLFKGTSKEYLPPNAVCGGTGFDLTTKLPKEIDAIKPHLNFGFTTRGCIRHCSFCVVPDKEGGMKVEGDLVGLWDGESRLITLYDNNILALPDHFRMICEQAIRLKLTLDFNQGLDHRLLNEENVTLLTRISHKEYHFAFDNISYLPTVEKAINLLQSHGIKRCNWYVLVGFDSTLGEDFERLNYLRGRGQDAYVQRYSRARQYIAMARWANQHHIFHGMTWEQFMGRAENKRYAEAK